MLRVRLVHYFLRIYILVYKELFTYTIHQNSTDNSVCFRYVQLHYIIIGVLDVPSNIEVRYYGVSWTSLIVNANEVHEPDVNLACQFDRLSDLSLYYDVTWYVDNTEVLTGQTVSSNASDMALLTSTQMISKGKRANSMVCSVDNRQDILQLIFMIHILSAKSYGDSSCEYITIHT